MTDEVKDTVAAADAVAEGESLVKMTKDGETLAVHPSCVAAHRRAGWKLA